MRDIAVIGAGVSGLTSALLLAREGFPVRVLTRDAPEKTTSRAAAAVWYPYLAQPHERVIPWAARSYEVFIELAASGTAPVKLTPLIEVFRGPLPPAPFSFVRGLRPATTAELPNGCASGWTLIVPVIDMTHYLTWLTEEVHRAGVSIQVMTLDSVDEGFRFGDAVVHCSGLGARDLVGDQRMTPIRGQNLRLAGTDPGVVYIDDMNEAGPTYLVPRGEDLILGGTATPGNESLEIDERDSEAVFARCSALVPGLDRGRILQTIVGIRPGRDQIRLEVEERAKGFVVHNYGHGGCGVSLSYGCAQEVVDLVRSGCHHPAAADDIAGR